MLRAFYRSLRLAAVVALIPVGYVRAQGHRWADDPGAIGHYTSGHTSYSLVDKENGNRPVYVSVWYPADARSITRSATPAQYPLDPYGGQLPVSTSMDW